MEWIDKEVEFPDCDRILCCADKDIFICEKVESKGGNFYQSTDSHHVEFQGGPRWTHWMHLPELP